jgi:hypothetical protein
MEKYIDDPRNIIGLGSMIDNSDKNLSRTEKDIINKDINIEDERTNIVEEYEKDLKNLENEFLSLYESNASNTTPVPNIVESMPEPLSSSPPESQLDNYKKNDRDIFDIIDSDYKHYDFTENSGEWDISKPQDEELRNITTEERKQQYVSNVMKGLDSYGDSISNMDEDEDDKTVLLEEITTLRDHLMEVGDSLNSVPNVDKNSSLSDIQSVYKILRIKNDKKRYSTFAEEIILALAQGIEYIFDGKREILGRRPDLTDWHKTVKTKLRRTKYETGQLVEKVVKSYNMSPAMRIGMELIPSAILYSSQRSEMNRINRMNRTNRDDLNDRYNSAISNMNSHFDE